MSSLTTPTRSSGAGRSRAAAGLDELDQRFHPAAGLRRQFNKVFPTHWSFMLGEIALYSFVILLLTGVYLALFFDPSMEDVVYDGAFANLRGVEMTRAYETTLDISFEVRGGLFMRQLHHWAALLFIASMMVHMLRTFFTGAFRKPGESNWLLGVLLLVGTFEGFSGYSLADDLLSGTGLRIGSGITLSVPVVGTWTHWALFGGEFPGTEIIPQLYIVHVLLLPGILLALHLAADRVRQRHLRLRVRPVHQRDHLGRTDRAAPAAAAGLLAHLPALSRPAARRPGGAGARCGDRDH